jgi:hypothetical protein
MDSPTGERRMSAKHPYRGIAVVAAVIILVIILLAVYLGSVSGRRYEAYLSGLWVGDPSFLEKAQLRDLQLFLAPREGSQKSRQGYLIMTDLAGNFISNQAIELRIGSASERWWTALKSAFRAAHDAYKARSVEIEYDSPAGDRPMPDRLKMSLSILDGTLTLYDDEKVYAFLEKDLLASAAAVEAYKAP